MRKKDFEIDAIDFFLEKLRQHAIRKANLYDGVNENIDFDFALRLTTEELGEIASALTRERFELAKAECLDLAHTAFLIYLSLNRSKKGEP